MKTWIASAWVSSAYAMERLAIPPDVGVWAPIRGREFLVAGTGLPYCDGYRTATFDLGADLWSDVSDLLNGLLANLLDYNLQS